MVFGDAAAAEDAGCDAVGERCEQQVRALDRLLAGLASCDLEGTLEARENRSMADCVRSRRERGEQCALPRVIDLFALDQRSRGGGGAVIRLPVGVFTELARELLDFC